MTIGHQFNQTLAGIAVLMFLKMDEERNEERIFTTDFSFAHLRYY